MASFAGLNAQVLGISVDHIPCLQAWAESLGGITFPLLSDFWPHGHVAECYDVFRGGEGITERAIFVLDGQGIIRYIDVHAIDQQPDNEEIRKVLREIEGQPRQKPVFGAFSEVGPGEPDAVDAAAAADAADAADAAGVYFGEDEDETFEPGQIILYCTRWCKDCKKARAWLKEHGLVFKEVDIDYDLAVRSRVRQWGGGHLITPVIDFAGTIVLDFDVEKLEAALRDRSGDQASS